MKTNYLYGFHAITEAQNAGVQIEKIYVQKGLNHDKVHALKAWAETHKTPFQWVPIEKLNTMVANGVHQGVVAAIAEIGYQNLTEVIERVNQTGKPHLFVMLDGVTDVRNIGAIARSAECMGADALILPTVGTAALNADAMKTSAGALNHIAVCREHHVVDTIHLLQAYGIQVIACTEKARETLYEADFSQPSCLLMGSEEKGISNSALKAANLSVKIPMVGNIRSLNVSAATAMVLGEIMRQRISVSK